MPEKSPLNWWERNVLWLVFALLIAGWWGVVGVLCRWTLDARVVWFATLNIVLTLRFAAGVGGRRSANFQRIFVLLAQMTGVWFTIVLAGFLPIIFLGGIAVVCLGYSGSIAENINPAIVFALIVGIGTSASALVSVFASRRRLMEALEAS